MEFKVKANLSNIRPSKSETPELSTSPTSGSLKLNTPAARELGVMPGDYLNVVEATLNGEDRVFIHKGKKGLGSKLASTGEAGGVLNFSSANAYQALKGASDKKVVYTIDTENVQESEDGTKYFMLTFARDEAKTERKKKDAVEA